MTTELSAPILQEANQPMTHEESSTVVGPTSKISLALLGGIFAVSAAALVGGTRWATRVETRLERIEEGLSGAGYDQWTESDMRALSSEVEAMNPGFKMPPVEHRYRKDGK